jgi:hypothetical protein
MTACDVSIPALEPLTDEPTASLIYSGLSAEDKEVFVNAGTGDEVLL